MPHATRNPTNKRRMMREQHASTASASQLSSSSSIFRELDELQRTNPRSVRFAGGNRTHESFDDLVEDGYDHDGGVDECDDDELQDAIAMRMRGAHMSATAKPQAEKDEDTADLEISVAEEGAYNPQTADYEDKHMDPVALAQDYIDAGEVKRKRRRRIAAIACVAVLAVVGIAVALGVVLSSNNQEEQQPASNKSVGEGSGNVADGGVQVASEAGGFGDGVIDDLLGEGASNSGNGSNNDNSRPAAPPSTTPQTPPVGTRYAEFYNRVVSISGADVLQIGSDTPQLRALQWLDSGDAANLPTNSEDVIPRYILAVLYISLGGEQWTTTGTEWLSGGNVCTWAAVECALVQNRNVLSKLNLANSNLSGSLPQEIGSLEYLDELSLHSNGAALSGEIPATIGNLSNLRSLFLQKNALVGVIPSSIGGLSNLVNLLLNDNQLSAMPSTLGGLSSLEQLHLYANQIEGNIPAELGNLSSLQRLWLSKNKLVGGIPAELGNLPNLKALYLDENFLSGPITPEIGNAASLEDVRLFSNMLTGQIPDTFQSLQNLVVLYLDANFLQGTVPEWIGTGLPKLQYLDLSMNRFSGEIPHTLGNLDELIVLNLSENQLSDSIPSTLGNLRKLQRLHLFGNTLRGAIPSAALAQLVDLAELRLERNDLSGTVSDALCSLGIGEFAVDCEEVVCSCCSLCGGASDTRGNAP